MRWQFAGRAGLIMSVKLNETKLKADIQQAIADYGRQMALYDSSGSHIHVWCSQPVSDKGMSTPDSMAIRKSYNFIIPALYCTIEPKLGNKIVDGSETYRITDIKPLGGGTEVVAYKITAER